MIDPTFDQFIRNKGYMSSETFNNSTSDLLKLLNYVKILPIQKRSFDIIKDLIKYYRGSIFIAFAPFYKRLQESEDKDKFEDEVKDIAAFVKGYLGDNKLDELNFFFFQGISKKKKKITQRSDPQNEFLIYVEKLGRHLAILKKNMNKMDADTLKLEIDSILAQGLNRKLNPLEFNYEQFFKLEADRIYTQNKDKIEQQAAEVEIKNKIPEPKPEPMAQKVAPMCCRTYFIDQQIIKQPQNLFLEYKNYSFPFDETRTNILKKTICGFLNTDGGIIFLGIHQNVDTKKRKVTGLQLNETEKENMLKSIRIIAKDISPDIVMNKMYNVSFVPIKSSYHPHNFIAGRFITKIVIKYGQRDEIYSYKYENKDYFSFRTENQVIHREGREVLNAYRDRIKNPLPKPIPIHEGACALPEKGKQIYENFRISNGNYNPPNQRKKYKERDANDYVILQIAEQTLLTQLQRAKLDKVVSVTPEKTYKVCFLKVLEKNESERVYEFISEMREHFEIHEIQRGIELDDLDEERQMAGMIFDIMTEKKINFKLDGNLIKLSSTQDAIKAFLVMTEMRFKVNFVAI